MNPKVKFKQTSNKKCAKRRTLKDFIDIQDRVSPFEKKLRAEISDTISMDGLKNEMKDAACCMLPTTTYTSTTMDMEVDLPVAVTDIHADADADAEPDSEDIYTMMLLMHLTLLKIQGTHY